MTLYHSFKNTKIASNYNWQNKCVSWHLRCECLAAVVGVVCLCVCLHVRSKRQSGADASRSHVIRSNLCVCFRVPCRSADRPSESHDRNKVHWEKTTHKELAGRLFSFLSFLFSSLSTLASPLFSCIPPPSNNSTHTRPRSSLPCPPSNPNYSHARSKEECHRGRGRS